MARWGPEDLPPLLGELRQNVDFIAISVWAGISWLGGNLQTVLSCTLDVSDESISAWACVPQLGGGILVGRYHVDNVSDWAEVCRLGVTMLM